MPKGGIDRLADVPIRWLVLGLLIAGIWIFAKLWIDQNDSDRYVLGTEGETLRIAVGQELDLTFQTIGPGEYERRPSISSSSLQVLDVTAFSPQARGGFGQRSRISGAVPRERRRGNR